MLNQTYFAQTNKNSQNYCHYSITVVFVGANVINVIFQSLLPVATKLECLSMEQRALKNVNNGKQSTVNKSLDGSMYPS